MNFARIIDRVRAQYEQLGHSFEQQHDAASAEACRMAVTIARNTAAALRRTGHGSVHVVLLSEVATDRATADLLRAAARDGRPDGLVRDVPFHLEGYHGVFPIGTHGAVSLPDNHNIVWRDEEVFLGADEVEHHAAATIVHEVNHTRNDRPSESLVRTHPRRFAALKYVAEVRAYILQAIFNDPLPRARIDLRLRENIERTYFSESAYPGVLAMLQQVETEYAATQVLDEGSVPEPQRALLHEVRQARQLYTDARTSAWASYGGNTDNH